MVRLNVIMMMTGLFGTAASPDLFRYPIDENGPSFGGAVFVYRVDA